MNMISLGTLNQTSILLSSFLFTQLQRSGEEARQAHLHLKWHESVKVENLRRS